MIIAPKIFQKFTYIAAAQSTRIGGVSLAPYQSLNLGKSTGDSIENVDRNRQIFFNELGFSVAEASLSHQVHGDEILLVFTAGNTSGYDAQITNIAGICLAVSIADCTPILIYDTENKAIAAIHAGWRGTVAKIVKKTLEKMKAEYGTIGENCFAYIGACISQPNFEVSDDVAHHFEKQFKYFDERKNKYFVDLKAANKSQLILFGIPENHIEISEYCTITNNDLFFSHRKENGTTGRMFAAIGLIL